MSNNLTRRDFVGGAVGLGVGFTTGIRVNTAANVETARQRLLIRIDCAEEYPPEKYFSHGQVKVIESQVGRYREAEGSPLSRFGYRFPIEHVGKPHLAIIRYPDDKRRFMCINDGTSYDLTTGLFTGYAQPLTGQMQELRQIFWPRWQDCSIVFMTWGEGEPAAAASIEIYELADLPALEIPADRNDNTGRELGIQYEDPCGCCFAEGAMDHEQWIDRIVQYARHSGQKLLAYPMAWYHGPQFPCECEPAGALGCVVAQDRKQYVRWTTKPEDWYARLLERFGREGLEFQGTLTLMRLGSLLQNMNIDLDKIKAGDETYNNMLWNNHVQSSTGDWTLIYNARNLTQIAEAIKGDSVIEPFRASFTPAYGERREGANRATPMFNPVHPVVQKTILRFVAEIGERYAKYPAFKGISFNMFASAMPWFGSIHAGYDDYTISLFEKETAINVPVDPKAPDRFSKRYEYLTYACRPAWVDWRCHKIRQFFGDIHSTLAATRPDLRVTATLYDETAIPGALGFPTAAHQLYARQDTLQFYQEAGIDIALYGNTPGLEIDLGTGNSRDRGGHPPHPTGGVNRSLAESTMFRDFDYLDNDSLSAVHAHDRPGVFIFNCWVEAWGKTMWFHPDPGDPNVAKLAIMDGKPADGIVQANSEYPKDGFWWDSQSRITPPFPGGVHFLEPYAHAVAELDACRITRGGLFLDKAHAEALQSFARPYRALPKRKFTTVGATTDPVAVRSLLYDNKRFFYVVNRDYYPIQVELAFNRSPEMIRDLATDTTLNASQKWPLSIGPYELRAFTVDPQFELTGFTAAVPPEISRTMIADADKAFIAFVTVRAAGKYIPGMDKMESRMRSAVAEKRFAWLRRALTGYIVRKCSEIANT